MAESRHVLTEEELDALELRNIRDMEEAVKKAEAAKAEEARNKPAEQK